MSDEGDLYYSFDKLLMIVFTEQIEGFNVGAPELFDIAKDGERIRLQALETGIDIETNLLVWTVNKNYYTFNLIYKDEIVQDLVIVKGSGQPTPSASSGSSGSGSTSNTLDPNDDLYDIKYNCSKLITIEDKYSNIGDVQAKMDLWLDGIFVEGDYLYFKVTMDNRTALNYEIDIVTFTKLVKEKKGLKGVSSTPEMVDIVYAHDGGLSKIPGKESRTAVYVIEKFALDSDKVLSFEVYEHRGDRERSIIFEEQEISSATNVYEAIRK